MKQSRTKDQSPERQYHRFGLQFHHFGLAVSEPTAAIQFLEGLGYRRGTKVFDPLQNVNLIMCSHSAMPAVELIFPSSTGQGPVTKLLAKHKSGLVYHLCFITKNLSDCLGSIAAAGIRLFEVSCPQPAVLFDGALVSFYMIPEVGLIEIIEDLGKDRP